MNICEERHFPEYKIIYKGVRGSKYNPTWMVCPICIEHKKCFSDEEQILEMVKI